MRWRSMRSWPGVELYMGSSLNARAGQCCAHFSTGMITDKPYGIDAFLSGTSAYLVGSGVSREQIRIDKKPHKVQAILEGI
jgi:hypothetical protein